jgi:ubiquinone/menaquinone biosynthesis C-methylase UbiE
VTSGDVTFDERVVAHYEAWYETPEGRRADTLEKASLRQLLESFPRARSVLEVGCGTAHFTRWLSDEGLAAVGLDVSAAMLAQAQALNGVLLVRGDALRLPFADGAFDLTIFITTLEFLERPREALLEALRVARHGVLLGVLNRWSVLGLQRQLAGLFHQTVYAAAHFYGVGELKRLLRSVTSGKGHIVWHTTLFPRWWPCPQESLPWGGFIGMALLHPEAHSGDSGSERTCGSSRG